jgi:flagellar assembly factor FliW
MPLAATERLGTLEYDDDAAIHFPSGLPGFEQHRRYLLVEREPLVYLQSLESAGLCFLTLPLGAIDASYQLAIAAEDLHTLGLEPPPPAEEVQLSCLAILAAAEDGRICANLLAPVVVNLTTRVGVQAVRADSRYSHCHPVGEQAPCL